jgi:hypothetical protein
MITSLTLNEVKLFNSLSVINLIFFLNFFGERQSNFSLTYKWINYLVCEMYCKQLPTAGIWQFLYNPKSYSIYGQCMRRLDS